jgi:hypothetical protein
MLNLNTYIIDTLADTLGHEPTLADLVGLDVPESTLTGTPALSVTLATRELTRRLRAERYERAS